MPVWVIRDGRLVEKWIAGNPRGPVSDLARPMISRFDAYYSPVDDTTSISSWRQRDQDMKRVDAVDRRDLPNKPFEERRARNARLREAERDSPTQWVDPA